MYERNHLLFSRRFSETFLNDALFKNFLLKMKKVDKFGLNYHRHIVQELVLSILRCSFWKYQYKISHPGGYFCSKSE